MDAVDSGEEGTKLLQAAFTKFKETLEKEKETALLKIAVLEQKRAVLLEEINKLSALKQEWGSIVRLNVGGKFFTTSRSTLTQYPESMFGAMFSGRHQLALDEEGRVFIDRDPKAFQYVLAFLRQGTSWEPPTEPTMIRRVLKEFDFYQLRCPELSSTIRHLRR